ncbi:DUF432 domain-containing protein [Staphylothermus hellenicus]|nr:DUF432 domain-containing protein [Staphylothermus hellenicus]
MSGYGVVEDKVSINDYVIAVEKQGEIVHYYRYVNNKVKVSKTIVKPARFELVPFYPVMLPIRFTNYILVKLSKKILVPSKEEVTIYVKIPVNLAVYAYGRHRRFKIIDVFSINKIKYALYGIPDRGVVARYWRSNPNLDLPEPTMGEAIALVNIRNRYDGWVEIGKILLNAQILRLYYIPKSWTAYTQVVIMAVNSRTTATIYYGRRIEANAKPILDPPAFKPPRIPAKTEMLWGLK